MQHCLGVSSIIIMPTIHQKCIDIYPFIYFPAKYVNIFLLMHLALEGVHKNSIQYKCDH